MALDILGWIATVLLMAIGLAGTVLPALPGTVFIMAGALLGAWIDGFQRVGVGTVAVIAVLGLLAMLLDFVAGLLGAKRVGASRHALAGAAIGTVAGLFLGLVGVLFLPFVGAVIGEWIARRSRDRAIRVGAATWLGIMAGMAAKVVLAFVMIGVFVAALLV
jgi:uncharacterized protein YqgC (DUF456 family)